MFWSIIAYPLFVAIHLLAVKISNKHRELSEAYFSALGADLTASIWIYMDNCYDNFLFNWVIKYRQNLTYIREHKKLLHTKLMMNGTLYTHLAEINRQAEEMFSELVNQMKTNSNGSAV